MKPVVVTRTCESCRAIVSDDRLSAYCVSCAAQFDAYFRHISNLLIDLFARRIERSKR